MPRKNDPSRETVQQIASDDAKQARRRPSKEVGSITLQNLKQQLKGSSFPASRDELLRQARQNKADEQIIVALQRLGDERFRSIDEVNRAVQSPKGKTTRQRR